MAKRKAKKKSAKKPRGFRMPKQIEGLIKGFAVFVDGQHKGNVESVEIQTRDGFACMFIETKSQEGAL